jgi:hypothetical protein
MKMQTINSKEKNIYTKKQEHFTATPTSTPAPTYTPSYSGAALGPGVMLNNCWTIVNPALNATTNIAEPERGNASSTIGPCTCNPDENGRIRRWQLVGGSEYKGTAYASTGLNIYGCS